ncbi:MAG: molecular chaperone DnaJ [Clostridia bacterium]|nr:molecular chaperone DnaJ [Clostridia bacterium]
MAEKRDYYEVLGVPKTATEQEIKSAFRKQAKTCHPDLHPGDKEAEARFKELNEAAEILTDADKRAKYDRYGHAAFDPAQGGGDPFGGAGFGGFGGFGDIFESVFGGGFGGYGSGRSNNGPVSGNDLRYNMTLTFEEAAFGVKKEILIPREETCETCHGNGSKPGTDPVRCTACGGTGTVRTQQQTILGSFSSTRPCSACGGTGKIIKEPCTDCKGSGRIRKNKRINVNVPAGIDNGQTISMRGEGEAGLRGGPNGDLYISVSVKPHKLFQRRGFDLLLTMDIPFWTAALGGEITVPTLNGTVKYTIPAGTQTGTTFRLRDQGIRRLQQSGQGDLLVTVRVDVPKKLNDEQRGIIEQLAESFGETASKPVRKSIFSKKK